MYFKTNGKWYRTNDQTTVEVPTYHQYEVTASVSGVVFLRFSSEISKENCINSLNTFLESGDFGSIEDMEWDISETHFINYKNEIEAHISVKGTVHYNIDGEDMTIDDIKMELVRLIFEDDFGGISEIDTEDYGFCIRDDGEVVYLNTEDEE